MSVAADLVPIEADAIRIEGARPLKRTLHRDPRGFLVETMRRDDQDVAGDHFAMSYTSVTIPGKFRDADRWHVHRRQSDRFVVTMGEMVLALYDARPGTPSHGRLEVVTLRGASFNALTSTPPSDSALFLVPIPPGVYHCIGNLSTDPFVLVNFPTELYDPSDEGRVPFTEARIPALGGPFSWDRVVRRGGATGG